MELSPRIRLCLPPLVLCVLDVSLTLHGQYAEYWAGNYAAGREGNPLAAPFLRHHPATFALLAVAWAGPFASRSASCRATWLSSPRSASRSATRRAASWLLPLGVPGWVLAVLLLWVRSGCSGFAPAACGFARPMRSRKRRNRGLLALHALDQNLRRLRPHDARVGQFAGAQLLAQLAAADRHLLVALRPVLVDQADAAQLLVEGREADLHRLDQQLALQLVELALRGQAVPDVLAVVVGGVGVLAADDDVGEAEVLPIDGVHDRLLRPAVEHLDVQAEQDDVVA